MPRTIGLKTRVVMEMISRPEGASLREIAEYGRWKKVGIKRHARLIGFQYRKEGDRYFMVTRQ